MLPTFESDFPLSRADVVEQIIHGAGEGGHCRFFDVRFDAITERFVAITRINHRGDHMAFAFRQQCYDWFKSQAIEVLVFLAIYSRGARAALVRE
jgi:hypothetical protein